MNIARVSVPSIDLKVAIQMYYERIELSTADIKKIFGGKVGDFTLRNLKRAAREMVVETGELVWDAKKINTRAAYKAWGLDIQDLTDRYKHLQKLKLIES